MSTTKTATVKSNKMNKTSTTKVSKEVLPVVEVLPVLLPVPQVAVQVAVPAVEVVVSETAQDKKKCRTQMAKVLSINISQARCATHLKSNLGDKSVEEEIYVLRKSLKAAKDSSKTEEVNALKKQIAEMSKTMVRISSETPIAAAVIWDGAVKELLCHGMDQAIAGDRKIVETCHLHDDGSTQLLYYPLYDRCEIWSQYSQEDEEELKKEHAVLNKAAKEVREAKKVTVLDTKKVKPTDVVTDSELDDSMEPTKTTFYTYVENALKTVKLDDPYKNMRVSNRVREYLSDLVAQGIARQAHLSRIIVQRVVDVRTMNADHIKAVVHMLMADAGRSDDQIEEMTNQIDDKLVVYHEHLKSEKLKKLENLDEVEKGDLERIKREEDLLRKKKQLELAKKRASDATLKVASLTALD